MAAQGRAPTSAPSSPKSNPLPSVATVALMVLASGCAALVFQVAWMREFRLVFGATTAAHAAVLAIFMAGLGVGSAVLGKWADRSANPLLMYGVLEIAIALSVAATPWLIALASSVYIGLGGQESLGLGGATAARLALAASVMAVPTFLMGGTLPAAVRSVTRAADENRLALGVLYGANTLGAVFGAAIATFFALEALGTRATLSAGCALGLLVGAIAAGLARRLGPLPSDHDSKKTAVPREVSPPSMDDHGGATSRARLIYLAAAVLGFTFFALEIVWYRMLGPILGGTAFTFGLILCIALFGIGAGGLAYNLVFRWLKPTWSALAITCACEALLTIAPFALGDRLAFIAAWQTEGAQTFGGLLFGWSIVAGIVVLPVAFVSGLQFPLLIALLGQGRRHVSQQLGKTYAWNTLGAIAGSLVAGFGALPLLTAPGMWIVIALLLALLSVILLFGSPQRERRSLVVVGLLIALTGAATFASGPTAAWRHSGIGAGRTYVPHRSDPNQLRQWINEKRFSIGWETDGVESSVGIDQRNGLAFIVNGKSDGNAVSDAPTQIGVSILGAALHSDPKTALVIGLGTGESAGWLAEFRNVERVDVVELEPAIDEMARRSRNLNQDVLNHPRVRRIYNDGREFVFTTNEKYDVIISEPSNPYRAGIAALYTTEFYDAVRKRLNPGGVFIQWLQAYEVDEVTINTVLATVGTEFKNVEVWQTMAADMQLVCSDEPLAYTVEELRERINTPALKDALAKAWLVDNVEGFLAHFVANRRWAVEATRLPFIVRNTDDCTVIEYSFAKTVGRLTPFNVEKVRDQLRMSDTHRPPQIGDAVDWDDVEVLRQQSNLMFDGQLSLALLPRSEDRDLVTAFDKFRGEDFQAAVDLWPAAYRQPVNNIQRLILARCYAEIGRPECLELISAAEGSYPAEAAALRAIYQCQTGDHAEALQSFEKFFALLGESPWVVLGVFDSAFQRAIDVSQADRDAAQRLFASLSKPFNSLRFNYLRLLTRCQVAEQLGPEHLVEALADLEPHIIWTAKVLKPRAEAYTAVNHPLAAQAQRDWKWFQDHAVKDAAGQSSQAAD